jgi:histidyl-tRNA synthetase
LFQPARGTRDFLPEEMLRRNWIFDRIRNVFEAYGYEPLGTPAFESWDMLKIKSGEDTINQIYYFRDKSDRELGLRFEWTASLCRVISTHRELPSPFKRYSIGPVWRYERPSEKRYREFWQADADIVGVEDTVADAEALAVAVDCLKSIGFEDFTIRLNDRRVLEAFVEISGLPKDRTLEIFRAVDKLDKIGVEGVKEERKESPRRLSRRPRRL